MTICIINQTNSFKREHMDKWIKISNFSTSGFLNQNWICWKMAADFPALLLIFQEGRVRHKCWWNSGIYSGWFFSNLHFTSFGKWDHSLSSVWEIIFHLNVKTCSVLLKGQRLWRDCCVTTSRPSKMLCVSCKWTGKGKGRAQLGRVPKCCSHGTRKSSFSHKYGSTPEHTAKRKTKKISSWGESMPRHPPYLHHPSIV